MEKVVLVLPAYNEAKGIRPLLEAVDRVLASLQGGAEIVLVDDGSEDGTAEAARSVALKTPLTIAVHPENRGLGPAIITGLGEALRRARDDRDLIVCMDSDNTHPPETIPQMLRRARDGADLVIASRYRRGSRQVGVPAWRRLLSYSARWLFWWRLRLPGVRDYTSGFRAYRAGLLRRGFERYGGRLIERSGFACTDELLVKLAAFGPRIAETPFILRYDRKIGRSKIALWRTIRETLKMLWSYQR
ncbi:MAG: glycosyltransferase [Candidatus Sumerlaeota bacterium]|nr:glycosyltransferase [Candidatus Sumerlaeota bacterium]